MGRKLKMGLSFRPINLGLCRLRQAGRASLPRRRRMSHQAMPITAAARIT
jgi:hypothetical protein